MSLPKSLRPIRSFVRREGRITKNQLDLLDSLFSVYGIREKNVPLHLNALFPQPNPVTVEIGFGNGHSLIKQALNLPQHNFIGIEVYRPGIIQVLSQIHALKLTNVRLINGDAIEWLSCFFPDHSINQLQIFFPDPWPKTRHHKRRLINLSLIGLVSKKMIEGGVFQLATDWENYAHVMLNVIENSNLFQNSVGKNNFSPRLAERPITKFEQRGYKLGHRVWDLCFTSKPQTTHI